MLEKGKISAFQMAIMMYPVILATAILSLPSTIAKYAMNDLWVSPLWASLSGFLTVYIVYHLHTLYPKQNIIQCSEQIIGRIPGKILGLFYLFYLLIATGDIMRGYGEFIVGALLPKTPLFIVIITMILVSGFAVRGGVEVIGRTAQIFVPIFIISLILLLLFLLPELELSYIFPLFENGIKPSIMGASSPQAWFGEFFLISFLLPFLSDIKKGRKWSMISVFAVMITMVITNLVILFLFGRTITNYIYPLMSAARYISIADFFEHIESVVTAMWVAGQFIKTAVFYYATVLTTAQILDLSSYGPIVFPIGIFIVLISLWGWSSFSDYSDWSANISPFYALFMQTILSLLLLVIGIVRKKT
ncbi:Spore germination protein YndE [Paraliobacillus sp. PM-2]|uniref:GerAB/ArcD/ProY family transporter n=1 Tax=Paraliobacillus sp. PM-2 TaxID=1462524 RepID=UPI00061BBFB2|nr:endospore germination permease [Paraliobacillus sp. PM-2]CQR46972.1 Spore germination protein YndE [Paraliobacillus sp. PM-2]